MARTFLVSELANRVRVLGDYLELTGSAGYSDSYMTDGVVIEALSVANAEVHEFYAESDEDYGTTRVTYSLSGSTQHLPTDFFKLRLVEVRPGAGSTGWVPLNRATADDNYSADERVTEPWAYRIIGDDLELIGNPTAGTMRLSYVPCADTLTSMSASVDGVNGYDNLIVLRAVRFLKMREGLDTPEWDGLISDGEARMRRSLRRRDRGGPRRLRDPRDHRYGRRMPPWRT